MEAGDIGVERSPRAPGWVRLRAEVRYATGAPRTEVYWFETPEVNAASLSQSGNPWLAALLPLAAVTGEPLRIALPVDPALLENATRLMRIWRAWHPGLAIAPIHADAQAGAETASPRRTAAFFSGGVDSFFTVLRDRRLAPPAERAPIQDLITVFGFDLALEHADHFARLQARHQTIAQELGLELVPVALNLRSTRWQSAPWGYLAHGAALAAAALSLERRFERVYIAGGGGYRGLHPWGSHSVTDPLFSTLGTAIVYDGVAWLRTEKTAWLAGQPTALQALRVCWEIPSAENCGVCNKCLRTMLTLELCDALRDCPLFPQGSVDLRAVARMDSSSFVDFRELQDIRALAAERGHVEAMRAIDRSLGRSSRRLRLERGWSALRRFVADPLGRPRPASTRRVGP